MNALYSQASASGVIPPSPPVPPDGRARRARLLTHPVLTAFVWWHVRAERWSIVVCAFRSAAGASARATIRRGAACAGDTAVAGNR